MAYKSNTAQKAAAELKILFAIAEPDNRPAIEPFADEILALVEKFGLSGQSGGSAPYVAAAVAAVVRDLCLQKPLAPITGADVEWAAIAKEEHGDLPLYQNKRCSALFKDSDGVRYLDAIAWKTPDGQCYQGAARLADGVELMSRLKIKGFPFTPKTFYVDVEDRDGDFYIKDPKQLKEAFDYYEAPKGVSGI